MWGVSVYHAPGKCKKGTREVPHVVVLFSQVKVGKNCPVPVDVCLLEVVEQLFPLSNQPHESLLGGIVFLVFLKVFGQVADAMSK